MNKGLYQAFDVFEAGSVFVAVVDVVVVLLMDPTAKLNPGIGIASNWSDNLFCSSVKRYISLRSCFVSGRRFCLLAITRVYASIIFA